MLCKYVLEIVYDRFSSCFNNDGTKSITIIGNYQLKVKLFLLFISSLGSCHCCEAVKIMEEQSLES